MLNSLYASLGNLQMFDFASKFFKQTVRWCLDFGGNYGVQLGLVIFGEVAMALCF